MNERLLSIVSEVYVSSEYVDAAAKQISTGNGNLAERTQSQACALEETAATMEEMTATVRANADNAYQASSLVASAHSHAKDGGEVVSKAISAMGEINTSSKKIGDIISVINEIAFKTDLLALNASVEAARAAEHGKEFAVVAAEVRNLSLRSAEAANEIGGLIGNSVEKIRMGSNLVNESGHTLNEIVESVKKAAEMVSEIAAASQEQSVGIEQVNRAMIQIDEVTQQNAALVEEAAATSEEMEEQAQQMLKKVSFFKTEK
jgi:methyl-accepting chemotaxis protein-1 (serine sensor receptor)